MERHELVNKMSESYWGERSSYSVSMNKALQVVLDHIDDICDTNDNINNIGKHRRCEAGFFVILRDVFRKEQSDEK